MPHGNRESQAVCSARKLPALPVEVILCSHVDYCYGDPQWLAAVIVE